MAKHFAEQGSLPGSNICHGIDILAAYCGGGRLDATEESRYGLLVTQSGQNGLEAESCAALRRGIGEFAIQQRDLASLHRKSRSHDPPCIVPLNPRVQRFGPGNVSTEQLGMRVELPPPFALDCRKRHRV